MHKVDMVGCHSAGLDIRSYSAVHNRTHDSSCLHRLVGLVVKASASRAEDPGFESRLRRDFIRGRVIPVT